MKNNFLILLLTIIIFNHTYSTNSKQATENFNQLMHIGSKEMLNAKEHMRYYNIPGDLCLNMFRVLYEQNQNSFSKNHIPKIIHQIWLGSPFPERFKNWQKKIKALHPDWEYKLWTEQEIKELNLVNKLFYDKADNYGKKSDIARYEILYRFGGAYVDVDVDFLKPLDSLHYKYDFYAGFEPFWSTSETRCLTIGNSIIGSVAGHPLLKYCIKSIKYSHSVALDVDTKLATVIRTGPMFLTKACLKILMKDKEHLNVILPSEYLYPLLPVANKSTFCIHHWTHSWLN